MSDQQIQCSDCGNAFVFTDAERTFYDSKGLASPPKRCAPCRKARKLASPDRGAAGGGRGSAGPPRGRNGGGGEYRSGPPGMGGARGGPRSPSSQGRGWGTPSFQPSFSERSPTPRAQPAPRGRGAPFGERRSREFPARPSPSPASPPARLTPANPAPRPTRPKFDITCGVCGTSAQVPFQPLEGREVFCQPCYRARRGLPPAEAGGVVGAGVANGVVDGGPVEGVLAADEGESTTE